MISLASLAGTIENCMFNNYKLHTAFMFGTACNFLNMQFLTTSILVPIISFVTMSLLFTVGTLLKFGNKVPMGDIFSMVITTITFVYSCGLNNQNLIS